MNDKDGQIEILYNFMSQVSSTWNSEYIDEFRKCLIFVGDLSVWIDRLKDIPQIVLLNSCLNECATANLFCSLGLYKHAMISLRLCLEHGLFAIQLSTNDLDFRKWKIGKLDMKWASIVDHETGIFSKTFINAYAPEFIERYFELITIATSVYRECSEYIHGNYETLYCLPEHSKYDAMMLKRYITRFESISYLLSIALTIRFKEYICDKGFLSDLEQPIMNNIGYLPEVQLLYKGDK